MARSPVCSLVVAVLVGLTLTVFVPSARGQALGTCCQRDGTCLMTTFEACQLNPNGLWMGGCVSCDIISCNIACCAADGTCQFLSRDQCSAISGSSQGSLTTCAPLPACPFAQGSCCFANGSCTVTTRIACGNSSGVFQGSGSASTCNDFCGPPRGACCRGAQCVFITQSECGEHRWVGPLVTCAAAAPQCCPVDINKSGVVSVQDIFDFLAAYFAGSMAADFNRNCFLSVQDIFDFLAAYFAGCP